MATTYSQETQKILQDFLETLAAQNKITPSFLADLQQMVADGTLDDASCIVQAIEKISGTPAQ
jgi:hypothetical protein